MYGFDIPGARKALKGQDPSMEEGDVAVEDSMPQQSARNFWFGPSDATGDNQELEIPHPFPQPEIDLEAAKTPIGQVGPAQPWEQSFEAPQEPHQFTQTPPILAPYQGGRIPGRPLAGFGFEPTCFA